MLMEGTPKIHLSPDEDSGYYMVWVVAPLDRMERRLEGLVPMPIAAAIRDEENDGRLVNKALKFTTCSSLLGFKTREDAEKIAQGLAHALETDVDYTEVEIPDQEVHYSA